MTIHGDDNGDHNNGRQSTATLTKTVTSLTNSDDDVKNNSAKLADNPNHLCFSFAPSAKGPANTQRALQHAHFM
jgi:hypothetical protein